MVATLARGSSMIEIVNENSEVDRISETAAR